MNRWPTVRNILSAYDLMPRLSLKRPASVPVWNTRHINPGTIGVVRVLASGPDSPCRDVRSLNAMQIPAYALRMRKA